MTTSRRHVAAAIAVLTTSVVVFGQNPQKPVFEVASVRAATRGTPPSQRLTETRLDLVNTSLLQVLLIAFRAERFELVAPPWVNTANFDIQATFPAGARSRMPDMLQTMLAERFGLVTHIEQRPIDAYELVVGKNGLTMKEVEPVNEVDKDFGSDPATKTFDRRSETLEGPVRTMMIPLGSRRLTERSRFDTWTTAQLTFIVDAVRITMPEFAGVLAMNVDKPVVDKTGLAGVYQFRIELDSNQSAVRGLRSAGITTTVRGDPIDLPTGVSTFKAVESLGLKLEERRTPFDVVVVDTIDQNPVAN